MLDGDIKNSKTLPYLSINDENDSVNFEMDNENETSHRKSSWLPGIGKYLNLALGVIWRDNIFMKTQMDELIAEPNWQTNIRAVVAIYCNVILWVAGWNLFSRIYEFAINYSMFQHYPIRVFFNLFYFILGLLIMIYNGTLYQNAGFDGTWRSKSFYQKHVWFKVFSSLIGQCCCTIGMWNLIYIIGYDTTNFPPENHDDIKYYIIKDIILYIVSLGIIIVTNSLWSVSCVIPPWHKNFYISPNLSFLAHFKYSILSILILIAYCGIWTATFDFLQNYAISIIWKELFYVSTGLLLFVTSGSFVANSQIWGGFGHHHQQQQQQQPNNDICNHSLNNEHNHKKNETTLTKNDNKKSFIIFIVYSWRAFLGLHAQIAHNTGAYTLFDLYLLPHHWRTRDIIYTIIGIIGLSWSKALLLNASITPFSIPISPDGLAMVYNDNDHQKEDKYKNSNQIMNNLPIV